MTVSAPRTTWDIGLNAWVIQDGNYPDFKTGQIAEFALEFWLPSEDIIQAANGELSATKVEDCLYDAVADVILHTSTTTFLDIGILVYQHGSLPLPALQQGRRVGLRLGLGVDPYFYFECLSQNADVPPLVYSWEVKSILLQTAPFIEVTADCGRKMRVRDPARLAYQEIVQTDAWNDDGAYGEYLLRCDLLPIPPKRISATANYP